MMQSFNQSIDAANIFFGVVWLSQSMKIGQVTSLLKKPDTDTKDFKNFQPITNITTISKIIERLALYWLRPYLST